jgi:two-component system phosphate regulon sensor histidine kinase PhoR
MNAVLIGLPLLAAVAVLAWWGRRERHRRQEAEIRHREERERLEHRHAAALREKTVQWESLLDRMVEGLIVIGADGRIRLANRAAGLLFGFEGSMVGRTLLEAVRHHEVAKVAAHLQSGREILGHEIRMEGATSRIVEVNAVALAEPGGALLVFHDLTSLRRLESIRQEFVANVSHELRTPLSLIRSAAETLIEGGKDDPQALNRFLEIIDRHSRRLALLIEDLLLLSALDSGRVQLQCETVEVAAAVRECLDDYAAAAHQRGATLVNGVPAGLWVRVNPARLRQVLANLIDNAIKYGRDAGRVRVGGLDLGTGWVEVFVGDDGPGIPAHACDRIFERFFRVDRARSRAQGGTGLGLAIVKNLVQAHGGDVRVESAEGMGTTFFLRLPAAPTGDAAVAAARVNK